MDTPYRIARNGQQFGPYSVEEIRARLRTGELALDDDLWREGMTDWQPLRSVSTFVEALNTPADGASESRRASRFWVGVLAALFLILCIVVAAMPSKGEAPNLFDKAKKSDSPHAPEKAEMSAANERKLTNEEASAKAFEQTIAEPRKESAEKRGIDVNRYTILTGGGGIIGGEYPSVFQDMRGMAEALYQGNISDEEAKKYLFTREAANVEVVKVVGDYVIYCGGRRMVQLALPLASVLASNPSALKKVAAGLEFDGYAHYVGREQFTTQTGLLKSVPVFEIISKVESGAKSNELRLELEATAKVVQGKLQVVGKTNLPDSTQFIVLIAPGAGADALSGAVSVESGGFGPVVWESMNLPPSGNYVLLLILAPNQPESVKSVLGPHNENLKGRFVEMMSGQQNISYRANVTIGGT